MNRNEIVRLALDSYNGKISGNFSKDETMSVLHKALVEANNGKNYLDIRDVRDGKCSEVFAIIEEVLSNVKNNTLTTDPFFSRFVDYRNLEYGDKNEIIVPDRTPFVVSEMGAGSQAIRRQKLVGGQKISVNTTWKGIKVYEEIDLVLSGRVDFDEMIARVAKSFKLNALKDIYTVWSGTISGLASPYAVTGSYSEADMLALVQHVRAENNSREAYIVGTLIGLGKITATHDTGRTSLDDMYNSGVVGMWNGIPKIEIAPYHVAGTDTFLWSDSVVNVLPGDVKPIVYVTEGQSLILPRNFADNADLTQEYLMMEKTGVAACAPAGAGKFGRYTISA